MNLGYNLTFQDLYNQEGLEKIDSYFIAYLTKISPQLCNKLLDARKENLFKLDESHLIIEVAAHLEKFLVELFQLEEEIRSKKNKERDLEIIFKANKLFIQKYILTLARQSWGDIKLTKLNLLMHGIELPIDNFDLIAAETDLAKEFLVIFEKSQEESDLQDYYKKLLLEVENYSLWAIYSPEGQKTHHEGSLFKIPGKVNYQKLVNNLEEKVFKDESNLVKIIELLPSWLDFFSKSVVFSTEARINLLYTSSILVKPCIFFYFFKKNTIKNSYNYLQKQSITVRDGFNLNDEGLKELPSLYQSHYCLYCHKRSKDSCSHGMRKTKDLVANPLGVKLAGCPLEQKISEMHYLRSNHFLLSTLATIMIDNPMVLATGHRICNDCMKACIFQKQEPVDTPMAESLIVKDILVLPYGFEIYSLLTRWNPLNFKASLPKRPGHHKVLVVGMGPAGFTLSHYLLREGIQVVGLEGLKIEALPPHISGINSDGNPCEFKPIAKVQNLFLDLEKRHPKGFGGVMEYGITVRWDKNLLDLIRIILTRNKHFRLYDSVQFGTNFTYQDAKKLGFHHVALALGAGSPNIPAIKNNLAKGVKTASDFLMSLQLGGAFNKKTLVPLQIRMPIVVVGAGLTALDTATEALQYYLVQIKKFARQYQDLGKKFLKSLSDEDSIIAEEFLSHYKEWEHNPDKLQELIKKWGGVTILYRRKLEESPAYKINHEELNKALSEGLSFIEEAKPLEVLEDQFGATRALLFSKNGEKIQKFVRTILLAAGTHPNRPYKNFPLTSSYLGDSDPNYNGSVVKAMASAKKTYKEIIKNLENIKPERGEIFSKLNQTLTASIEKVIQLNESVLELVIKAPAAAKAFKPGLFYRLQKYGTISHKGHYFPIEPLAMTGAEVEGDKLSLIVLDFGLSSHLCKKFQVGEKISLMGPSGKATPIPANKKVLLIGGGLGNAVLISIGKALKKKNCEVIYFAGYRKLQDRFKVAELEKASNRIVWVCEEGFLDINREGDRVFHGNLIEALEAHSDLVQGCDKLLVVGSDGLMKAVADIKDKLPAGLASVNSPMNCMMGGICGQCLQRHKIGNKELYLYSCTSQDQDLDKVDFSHLKRRLEQNSLSEKITKDFYKKIA